MVSSRNLTYVVHKYDQKAESTNLLDAKGGLISRLRWHYWTKNQRKKFLSYYLFKTWGPPTFKIKKTFKELPADLEKANPSKYSVPKREKHGDKHAATPATPAPADAAKPAAH